MTETQQKSTLERVGSYPVVASTLDQVKTIYERCKDANNLLKYSLETAETGAKLLSDKASPVVQKLPIATVNGMALNQLEKLEEKYPIVTKPTDEVLEETRKLYETTLKPTVDKVQAVGQLASDKYTGAKGYATEKLTEVKDYGMNKVQNLSEYGTEKATQLKEVGSEKLNTFLESPQGKAVVEKLDQALDYAETYVDKYLPEEGEEGKKEGEGNEKARSRLYNRMMKEMNNLQLRSQETLQNLHFTVNLIEYARTNLDSAKTKVHESVQAAQEKGQYYWNEIRKEPEEGEESSKTLEEKAIRMARHLSHNLRGGLYAINEKSLPTNVLDQLNEARQYTSDLVWSLAKASKVEELPAVALSTAKDQIFRVQEALLKLGEVITPYLPVMNGNNHEVEMEEVSNKKEQEANQNGGQEEQRHEENGGENY